MESTSLEEAQEKHGIESVMQMGSSFIKPGVKNYPVLRDLHCFEKFEIELMIQAYVDSIHDVFDSNDHPSTHK